MNHIIRSAVAAAVLGLVGGVASAQTVELQQNASDALPTGSFADNYYNGGWAGNSYTSGPVAGYPTSGVGPSLGFTFSSNADVQSAGTSVSHPNGRFEDLPADPDHNNQILYFSGLGGSGTTDAVNFAQGFNAVTFNYALSGNNSAYNQTADVWSGLNGTGTLLGTIALSSAATTTACSASYDLYCSWSSATANAFSGVGQSVTFGVANSVPSENLELAAVTVAAVPEPDSVWLMLGGLAGLVGFARRKRRAAV